MIYLDQRPSMPQIAPWRKFKHGYISSVPQSDKINWIASRIGYITSTMGYYIIHHYYRFPQDIEEYYQGLALYICGLKADRPSNSPKSPVVVRLSKEELEELRIDNLRRINIGIEYEPITRQSYTKITGRKVEELGFAISSVLEEIGTSIDGLTFDPLVGWGIIEIKCPEDLYDVHEEKDIKPAHYIQMQHSMFILQVKFCDYVIHGIKDKKIRIIRVWPNKQYWDEIMLPKYKWFNETYLEPIMRKHNISRARAIPDMES